MFTVPATAEFNGHSYENHRDKMLHLKLKILAKM